MDVGAPWVALRSATVPPNTTPTRDADPSAANVASCMLLLESLPAECASSCACRLTIGRRRTASHQCGGRDTSRQQSLQYLRIEFNADRVSFEFLAREPVKQLLGGCEVIDLQFDPMPVRVFVIHRRGGAVVDAPHRFDAGVGQSAVGGDELLETLVGERNMIKTPELSVRPPNSARNP